MTRTVPRLTTDEEAERFLEQDLSDLDFSQFKPVRFSFANEAPGSKGRDGQRPSAPEFADPGNFYVVRRAQSDYAVRRGGAARASAIHATQAEAIKRAREMDPYARIQVERVRRTGRGSVDRWRKA